MNLSINQSYPLQGVIVDSIVNNVEGTILTNQISAYNTFDSPEIVSLEKFSAVEITEKGLEFEIPPL